MRQRGPPALLAVSINPQSCSVTQESPLYRVRENPQIHQLRANAPRPSASLVKNLPDLIDYGLQVPGDLSEFSRCLLQGIDVPLQAAQDLLDGILRCPQIGSQIGREAIEALIAAH